MIGEQDEALKELTRRRRSTVLAKVLRPKVVYKKAIEDHNKDHWKRGQEARKKDAEKTSSANKAYDRVYTKLNSAVAERVKSMFPGSVGIYTDPPNGRWKLSYRTPAVHMTRSISWTQVGQANAARACVQQAWAWVEAHEGRDPPASLQERLCKAFPS